MENIDKKIIGIVGLGYVGLPLALLADRKGYEVIGVDTNESKVQKINQKISPFADTGIAAFLPKSGLKATMDFGELVGCSIIVVCVPTPINGKRLPDLAPLESAMNNIGKHLKKGQLVILESTVNPGVSENVVLPILERCSGLKAGVDFYLAHCPERINPGDLKWGVENIARVIGSLEEKGAKIALEFYGTILASEVKMMNSLKEAEAVKVVENAFRDINIAFVNELAMSFYKLGIDVKNVLEGAATKPFAFMPHLPGCGVGGHCIPVDPYYLIDYAKKNGFNHNLLRLARKINNHMPEFTVKLTEDKLETKGLRLAGAKVAVLGLAYKPDVDDCRESPAYKIISLLQKKGAKVSTFDPFVPSESSATSLEEAISGANAVIIATGHSEFRNLTADYFTARKVAVLVDGRNCLAKKNFNNSELTYQGIGC